MKTFCNIILLRTTNLAAAPPLSQPRYDVFSGAVHVSRPYGAPYIFHSGGSVAGVGVVILALRTALAETNARLQDAAAAASVRASAPGGGEEDSCGIFTSFAPTVSAQMCLINENTCFNTQTTKKY